MINALVCILTFLYSVVIETSIDSVNELQLNNKLQMNRFFFDFCLRIQNHISFCCCCCCCGFCCSTFYIIHMCIGWLEAMWTLNSWARLCIIIKIKMKSINTDETIVSQCKYCIRLMIKLSTQIKWFFIIFILVIDGKNLYQ